MVKTVKALKGYKVPKKHLELTLLNFQ